MLKTVPRSPEYLVSDLGEVFWTCRDGSLRKSKLTMANTGYLVVWLGTKVRQKPVHLVVLEAFSGPRPEPGMVCRHLDGDRLNNSASNLVWGTDHENARDQIRHHGKYAGAVLSKGDVEWIRAYPKRPGMFSAMARRLQVSVSVISSAYYGHTWKHVA